MGRPIVHYDDPKKERSAERRRERERRYMSKPEVKERRREYMRKYQREHKEQCVEAVRKSRLRKVFKEHENGKSDNGDSRESE